MNRRSFLPGVVPSLLAVDCRTYPALDVMLAPGWTTVVKALVIFAFLVLIVAPAFAVIMAIKSIGAAGSALSETTLHSML